MVYGTVILIYYLLLSKYYVVTTPELFSACNRTGSKY